MRTCSYKQYHGKGLYVLLDPMSTILIDGLWTDERLLSGSLISCDRALPL